MYAIYVAGSNLRLHHSMLLVFKIKLFKLTTENNQTIFLCIMIIPRESANYENLVLLDFVYVVYFNHETHSQ